MVDIKLKETPWYEMHMVPILAGVLALTVSILVIIYVPTHYNKMPEDQYEPNNICPLNSHPMYGSFCDAKWLEDRSNTTDKWQKCNEKVKAKDRSQKGFKCVQHNCFNQEGKNIDPEGFCVNECPEDTEAKQFEEEEEIKICEIDCKDDQKYFISHKKCLYDVTVTSG